MLCVLAAINLFGLELGMSIGILMSMVSFIYDYARVPVVNRVKLRSNVIRSLPLSSLLADKQDQIITLRCRGYIFFGSTLQIMDSVMRSVTLPPSAASAMAHLAPSPAMVHTPYASPAAASTDPRDADPELANLFRYQPPGLPATQGGSSGGLGERHDSGPALSEGSSPTELPTPPVTRFILFDFTSVTGLDATAARSCFLNLTRTLTPLGIKVMFGGVPKGSHIERLLIGHEILDVAPPNPEALRFDTIDEALEYCEEDLINKLQRRNKKGSPPKDAAAAPGSSSAAPTVGQRRDSSSLSQMLSPLVETEWSDMLEGLAPFFREKRYNSGGVIFRKGALAHSIYFITQGEVTLWAPSLDGGAESGETTPVAVQHAGSLVSAEDSALGRRLVRYVDGGIFGELDFFLRHPRSFSAVASTPDTCVQVLTRDALQSMQSQAPQLAAALEHALLKYLSFQVNAKLGLSDGVSDASRHS